MMMAVLCGVLAIACMAAGAFFFIERPTVVRVAVPTDDRGDYGLLTAAGKVVRHGHHPIRFKIVPVESSKAGSGSVDAGKVDMAVVRTDESMPADGQTVVILHRDAAILVAPGGSPLKEIGDLADHTVGILAGQNESGNTALLQTALAQYEVPTDGFKTVLITQADLADAFESKRIDAVLAVGIVSDAVVQGVVKTVADAGEGQPVFLAIPDADAIAQRALSYDSFQVVKGAFRGSPPHPAEEFQTLSVTYRIVASSTLSESVVADVTRFFLSERGALVAVDPLAQRIEAPSTDKGSALPAHAGTAAYIDDEEETFLDQYSDFIYLGAMFFGVLASGATAVFSRINAQGARAVVQLTLRLVEILMLVRGAASLDVVAALEAETDDIVSTALQQETARNLDERQLGALSLALDQVREAIRDRRTTLESARERASAPDYTSRHVLLTE